MTRTLLRIRGLENDAKNEKQPKGDEDASDEFVEQIEQFVSD
jgi:hypothetical protein